MDAIILQNISKKYTLAQDRPILLKNLFLPQKKEEVWALKNISLSIKKGETIGIIGENGSGKSTLLKIISGITSPTSGTVSVNGRVASLIELGAGFHQDLTGRENVYLNGTLLGLTRKEIDKKYKDIVSFADIDEYINQPVRTYSSGMTVRLGFSVAIHLDPDILLIDEVLAVGDEEFQRKCIWKLRDLIKVNKTILLVSHNLNLVRQICNNVFWINKEGLIIKGAPTKVIEKYINEANMRLQSHNSSNYVHTQKDFKKVSLIKLQILSSKGEENHIFKTGEKVYIKVAYRNRASVRKAKFGIVFYSNYGEYLYGFLTPDIFLSKKIGSISFSIPRLILLDGKYPINIAVADSSLFENFDWREQKIMLQVKNEKQSDIFGSVDLKMKFNYL